jgi:beta-glucosidase
MSLPQDTTPAGTPPKVLRGFEKVLLEASEMREVRFELMRRDLSYWDGIAKQWVIPEGSISFMTGFSSKDLHARAEVIALG